jgi:hypothetical protein
LLELLNRAADQGLTRETLEVVLACGCIDQINVTAAAVKNTATIISRYRRRRRARAVDEMGGGRLIVALSPGRRGQIQATF